METDRHVSIVAVLIPRISPLSVLRHFSCGPLALLQTMIFVNDEKKLGRSDLVKQKLGMVQVVIVIMSQE